MQNGTEPYKERPLDLWEKILMYAKKTSFMGCSINGSIEGKRDDGLLTGHAYSLIDAFEIQTQKDGLAKLLRIQNPWGSMQSQEWNGDWSDGSLELIHDIDGINQQIVNLHGKEAELFNPDKKDGQFIMCFDDYYKAFTNMCVVFKFDKEWNGVRFTDVWNDENLGGMHNDPDWHKNLKYRVDIDRQDGEDTS